MIPILKNQKIPIAVTAITLIAIALAATTYGALTSSQNLASSGSITVSANLKVYQDSACTTPLTTINWGTIAPGGSTTQTIYIKNTGTASLTLNMTTSNWNPTNANNYIAITWDKEAATLAPGATTAATLTLNVASNIAGIQDFSVQITITGTSS